jgi:hypothetical protein
MANLLKKELVTDENYQDFLTDCHRCKQQLKQTEFGFLVPPSQRSQCRYFNVERLVDWATMVQMTRTLEKQLKVFGLNQESVTLFSENISHILIPPSLYSFYDKIINYLKSEIEKIQDNRTILATSDVLESIFGKYKHFSKRCPLKDFRQTLLTIPLLTMDLTSDLIKQALETVRCRDLSEWINEIFGQSMLSKRKAVFDRSFDDMKVV